MNESCARTFLAVLAAMTGVSFAGGYRTPGGKDFTVSEREIFVDHQRNHRSGHMGHALVDAANDLQGGAASAYDWGTTNGLAWTQALSPDGAAHLFDPVQKSEVFVR